MLSGVGKIMGVLDNATGAAVSGVYLTITALVAIKLYGMISSSGLPLVGSSGNGSAMDVYGGQ